MAYASKELKAEKMTAFKKAFPAIKATFSIRHGSTLVLTIKNDELYEKHTEGREEYRESGLAVNMGRKNEFYDFLMVGCENRSDAMRDYFDVDYYVEVKIKPQTISK